MKHRTLLLAAVVPLAAAGAGESLQGKIDVRELRQDIRATDVMRGDKDAGDVEDLLVAADGSIEAVLVEDLDGGNDVRQQPVDAPQDGALRDDDDADDDLARIAWDAISYDPDDDSVSLDVDKAGSQPAARTAAGETFLASDIVGMEVHLSDAESFGEVEDLMIDGEQGKVSAVLVDTWQGFDKRTYALPVELDKVNTREGTLAYGYTESEVTSLQEYRDR